jgi:ech hydrogenase subunit A
MPIPLQLIALPLVCGILIACIKGYKARKLAVFASSILIASLSIYCVVTSWASLPLRIHVEGEWISWAMLGLELVMAGAIAFLSIKYKKRLGFLLALVMAALGLFFEFRYGGTFNVVSEIMIDQLTVIMLLIVGIVGSLIGVYASGYMQTYQEENPGVKDRRRYFFFVIFLFLTGMYGLVLSNSVQWMYFFWEITTFCSFLLIGYTRTPEAVNNSFRTVILNMIGGITFQIAIIALAEKAGVLEFDRLGTVGAALLIFPLSMLCLAGFTKTAMFPFSSWLLGAMVAPTPVSALLHSSTMVKAGVYLFLRIAPFLGGTIPGSLSAVVGGVTFLLGAILAISQRNAKRVLAYSTISNLGLMVACAGVGTYQTIWVAVFLMIFHAVAKSLMFLTVGTASNGIGSLEIEDMTGLIIKMPRVAIMMIAGICGMFVAPFGMLISKWAAMEAFINLNNVMSPIMIILIAYGSAATIFFWTKWMGTIMRERNPHAMKGLLESHMSSEEFSSEFILTILTVLTCFLFPLISSQAVEPYLLSVYGHSFGLSLNNVLIMTMMIGMILVIPTVLILIPRKHKSVIGTAYMGGCTTTEDLAFENSLGEQKHVHVKSYYLENFFNEKLLFPAGVIITAILIMVLVGASVL